MKVNPVRAIIKGKLLVHADNHSEVLNKLLETSCRGSRIKKIDPKVFKIEGVISPKNNIDPINLEELLLDYLNSINWLPNLPQNDPLVVSRANEILKSIRDDDISLTMKTFVGTIAHTPTQSWGIINRPANFRIEFRIKEPIPRRLREACEQLVSDLHGKRILFDSDVYKLVDDKATNAPCIRLQFDKHIEVLEPNSEHQAFIGQIFANQRWKLAIAEKRTDFVIGIIAGILAAGLIIVTTPPVAHIFSFSDPEWFNWLKGTFDRLATTAFFTASLSSIRVYLYWTDLRKHSTSIRWITSERAGNECPAT